MKLTLAGNYLNTTYADDNGKINYKSHTTSTFPGGKTNIVKVLPADIPRRQNSGDGEAELGDRFAHMARIDWKIISDFQLGGEEVSAKKFFRREIWAAKKNRIFTGEDGKEYRWLFGAWAPELILNDGSKTQVAVYHPTKIFGPKRPGVLEIHPEWEHMADIIIVTFIYVETLRRRGD
ncbi:hypothetical protein V5O48_012020 [Marasmius crinis-equi]|uniref:DUF6593 domain-containing protein n=1 Tax=Marasmius crinis-equi TaxID=585013 RepID=A0ABR3F491_9AGAR